MLRDILFTSCFNDVFPRLKHWLSDYMRHEMFIHVYFMLNLEVKRKGWSHWLTLHAAVLTEAFIQWSVTPYQRAPKRHYCLNILKKIEWFVRYTYILVPKVPYRKFYVRISVPLHPYVISVTNSLKKFIFYFTNIYFYFKCHNVPVFMFLKVFFFRF